MAQWRIDLGAEDIAALSRGDEITVSAIDEDEDDRSGALAVTDVTISLRDL